MSVPVVRLASITGANFVAYPPAEPRVVPCPTCRGRGFLPEMRACANERCDTKFRWQDDDAARGRRDAIYCSRKCAKAQAERERRRRLRGAS